MKVLIIYDSYFGNTKNVATIIGDSLKDDNEVTILPVIEAKLTDLDQIDLLIAGSPTRAFRPTKKMVTFLKSIPSKSLKGIKVAAFDTRISLEDTNSRFLNIMVSLFGYAADPLAKILTGKGGILLGEPFGFLVNDSEGPLKDGEKEKALLWKKQLIDI